MKKYFGILIKALLVSKALQACVSDTTSAFPTTGTYAVEILATPKTYTNSELKDVDSLCSKIATSTNGICCNPMNLHAYWNSYWKNELQQGFQQIKTDLEALNLASLKSSSVSLSNVIDNMFIAGFFGTNPADESKRQELKDLVTEAAGSDILSTADIPDLTGKYQKCVDSYLKFKEDGICVRCAGNIDEFYNSETKEYSVYYNICDDLVKDCTELFTYTAAVNRIIKGLVSGIGLTSSMSLGNIGLGSVSGGGFDAAKVDEIKGCAADLDACVADQTKKIDICQEFRLVAANTNLEGDLTALSSASTLITAVTLSINQYQTGAISGGGKRRTLTEMAKFIERNRKLSRRSLSSATDEGKIKPVTDSSQGVDMKSSEYKADAQVTQENDGDGNIIGDGNGGGEGGSAFIGLNNSFVFIVGFIGFIFFK